VLTAIGHNLRLILKWLKVLLRKIIAAISSHLTLKSAVRAAR